MVKTRGAKEGREVRKEQNRQGGGGAGKAKGENKKEERGRDGTERERDYYKKLREQDPCSEMTGFTRMLNSVNRKPDGLMDEMPTVVVDQLKSGSSCHDSQENDCDMGFPVMNRPHGVTQLLEASHGRVWA